MTKAEERALEAYPEKLFVMDFKPDVGPTMGDNNECYRNCYQRGYEQAEKDMMECAVETAVSLEAGGFPFIEYGVGELGLKVGDKVKLIIVKEEEK